MRIVHIDRPLPEPCAHGRAEPIEPPAELVEPRSEKRLITELRSAAATRDAPQILARASVRALSEPRDPHTTRVALAMADLAATGREAARSLARSAMTASDVATLAAKRMPGLRADDPALLAHAARMLERANAVARHLVLGQRARSALAGARADLGGWIGVSGEDDLPLGPVNVDCSDLVQRRITVRVRDHALQIRYGIAGRIDGGAPIVLLLHGHSSRLEEHERLAAALAEVSGPDGKPKYCIVTPDLPGCGYSSRIEHGDIAPIDAPGAPTLDFLDAFVDAFVSALTAEMGVPKRIACIAGGSMGGNIVLRLAEQSPEWIERYAAWSPASVWSSLTGDLIKGLGLSRTRDNMCADESPASRRAYFKDVFASRICLTGRTQPEMWYRDDFHCRPRHITRVMWDRREIYGAQYRRWHWRLAHEQLVFSHVQLEDGVAPWQRIRGPVLLVAGAHDNFSWTHIHDRTRDLGHLLASRNVPGTCVLLSDTGHSIHDERPGLLAKAIHHFIEAHPPVPRG